MTETHQLLAQWLPGWMTRALFVIDGKPYSAATLIVLLLLLVIIWWLSVLLERALLRLSERRKHEPGAVAATHLLTRIVRYSVWVFGTLFGLNYLGIDLSNVALLGSAFAVGLGFGLQNIFSNFAAGIIVLFERSLKVGDFVELESGVKGNVREIAMRYTRITTNDALDVLVPNSEFINDRVVSWTYDDSYRRMHIPFGVAYGTPKEKVRDAAVAAARTVPGVLQIESREPTVWLVEYGDNSVNYELIVWADRRLTTTPAATHATLMWALDDALHAANIEIPFPQRDLHWRSGTVNVRLEKGEQPDNSAGA
ncbi:mechanosensitive ion channel domain-containing protein [Hydrogenophaga sp. 5NK40-0174]|uniref:mechanosensitive ion channel family protein n=1 Tax=Hydrogenophaga sp. 5NK40-0174 TaxID=3127649 RepID=UPI003103DDA6